MTDIEDEEVVDDGEEPVPEVEAVVEEEGNDEEKTAASAPDDDEEEEVMTVKSELTNDDEVETKSSPKKSAGKRKRGGPPPGSRKGRTPAVQGLSIPFRAIKRTMKLDSDIGTVQNEAAIVTTMAAELFVKRLATQSHQNAKNKGRNTIRYEDVAEARSNDPSLSFLEILIP
mmetsp:Transcript_10125/g.14856  ORF Transcript_10125/g.14856 Transcript_10125/m.14856 type:complete len:172 (-) Transcript_10125:523-1038(-)|eukprot:CAMPEP_0194222628 /NCGR_PEP_ID=MMETSP0156-20130528/33403_1 /TAXON_ID=33649 /ORGANISM="Thalassionema nitzschioides, Strain L26-B" /LENGTH=171 /DNA_ID=CAMNT_0038953499 /DNA_START=55 /DNA_END=570 /DNA_ORIENTATION=+